MKRIYMPHNMTPVTIIAVSAVLLILRDKLLQTRKRLIHSPHLSAFCKDWAGLCLVEHIAKGIPVK